MEKDFAQLNDKDLQDVVGGVGLKYTEMSVFEKLTTELEAREYLIKCGVRPSDEAYRLYMNAWLAKHSN